MRTFSILLIAATAIGFLTLPASAELGSNNPTDGQLLTQREQEAGCTIPTTGPPICPSGSTNVFNSGSFDIAVPPAGTTFEPAKRVPRGVFGEVGRFMLQNGLTEDALDALVYPDAKTSEKNAMVEGLQFFTMFHTASQGLGPINNQPACLGCHLNAAEAVRSPGLLQGQVNQACLLTLSNCTNAANVSNVTRAGRSTPTNFEYTSLDPTTGGGVAPDNFDALNNTGRTAAFTTFGDFDPNHADASSNPDGIGFFDPLDGETANIVTGTDSPAVWRVRTASSAMRSMPVIPKPLPPVCIRYEPDGTEPAIPPHGRAACRTALYRTRVDGGGADRRYHGEH